MRYMGSKTRISKHILPIILQGRTTEYYVEPFVGGGNLIDKVAGDRLGSDIDRYSVEALIAIRDHVDLLPKDSSEISEEEYKLIKVSDSFLKGYAGYALSYGGKWFGGWCRDRQGKRDHVAESYRNAVKQSPKLQGVHLICAEYDQVPYPENCIIYCDPPYLGTTGYRNKFNHDRFWTWCRHMSKNHKIFISEYSAPSDFKCVYEKTITSSLTKNTGGKKGVERLYTI